MYQSDDNTLWMKHPKREPANRVEAWISQGKQMRTHTYIQKCIGVIENKTKPWGERAS